MYLFEQIKKSDSIYVQQFPKLHIFGWGLKVYVVLV